MCTDWIPRTAKLKMQRPLKQGVRTWLSKITIQIYIWYHICGTDYNRAVADWFLESIFAFIFTFHCPLKSSNVVRFRYLYTLVTHILIYLRSRLMRLKNIYLVNVFSYVATVWYRILWTYYFMSSTRIHKVITKMITRLYCIIYLDQRLPSVWIYVLSNMLYSTQFKHHLRLIDINRPCSSVWYQTFQ